MKDPSIYDNEGSRNPGITPDVMAELRHRSYLATQPIEYGPWRDEETDEDKEQDND